MAANVLRVKPSTKSGRDASTYTSLGTTRTSRSPADDQHGVESPPDERVTAGIGLEPDEAFDGPARVGVLRDGSTSEPWSPSITVMVPPGLVTARKRPAPHRGRVRCSKTKHTNTWSKLARRVREIEHIGTPKGHVGQPGGPHTLTGDRQRLLGDVDGGDARLPGCCGERHRLGAHAAPGLEHPASGGKDGARMEEVGERGRLIDQPLALSWSVSVDVVWFSRVACIHACMLPVR